MTAPTAVTAVAQLNGHAGVNMPSAQAGDNTNGNTVLNNPGTIFWLTNTGGASGTWTITPAVKFKGESLATLPVTIAASGGGLYKFDPDVWGHQIVLTPSAATMKAVVIQP